MGQIGCPSLDQLGPDFLWHDDWTQQPLKAAGLP